MELITKNSLNRGYILLSFCLLIFFFSEKSAAQTKICKGSTKNYTVDTQAPDGSSPDGTPNSTYDWSVSPGGAFTGNITKNGNKATINWGTTPAGTYTIQVIETNSGCSGDPVSVQITIEELVIANGATTINNCNGSFTFDPSTVTGNIVPVGTKYKWTVTPNPNITGAMDRAAYDTAPISGTLTNSSTSDQTVTYNVTAQSPGGGCEISFTVTVTVKGKPVTSAINLL